MHLPIGISFFTFHAISYLADIYRRKALPADILADLDLYLSFFPKLIAGPITPFNSMASRLSSNNRRHHLLYVAYGLRRFTIGLGKKVILANSLGSVAVAIFALPAAELSTTVAWAGLIAYTLQIFFNFAGYSDMAIGLARIFGFSLTENFNYPYISRSIREFWQRWHISLSLWFRDYLYIPLGDNRCPVPRQYFNLCLVFFLCGLWHGASWNFIVWGLFHGLFLVLERTRFHTTLSRMPGIARHSYAMLVIMIGWVFIRANSLGQAFAYLKALFLPYGNAGGIPGNIGALLNNNFNIMVFGLAILLMLPTVQVIRARMPQRSPVLAMLRDTGQLLVLAAVIIRLSSATHTPFIYTQF